MARIRTIKPEFWASEQVMELSVAARLAFIGLWNFSDDRGVHTASAKRLKAELFPSDDVTSEGVATLMVELIQNDLVGEFEAGGKRYWYVTGWDKHQIIRKPTYRHPPPPGWVHPAEPTSDHSDTYAAPVPNRCGTNVGQGPDRSGGGAAPVPNLSDSNAALRQDQATPEGKGMEGKGKEGVTSRKRVARLQTKKMPEGFAMSDKLKQWASSKGYQDLDAHLESFVSKAAANGYLYADWDAALQNAIRDDWAKLRQPGRAPDTKTRQRVDL